MLNKKSNLRLLNVVAAVLAIVVIVIAVCLINVHLTASTTEATVRRNEARQDTSIVRLHDTEGRFFCSGVVIGAKRILTAAHCVIRVNILDMPSLVDKVEIRTQSNAPRLTYATVEAINARQDLATLKGDFRGLSRRVTVTNSSRINAIFMNPESRLVACGFPDGGPLRCSHLDRVSRVLFFFSARGWLYPGMSGGPVIDGTGAVIAVNQAVTETDRIIVSPLIELYDNLGLDEASAQ